jgi:phasin
MSENYKTGAASKVKAAKSKEERRPIFKFPLLEMPSFAVPASFQDFAETNANYRRETLQALKATTDEMVEIVENTYAASIKSVGDYGLEAMEAARANIDAVFDFGRDVIAAKSFSDMAEISTAQANRQFTAMVSQNGGLWALAWKVAANTAQPIANGVPHASRSKTN